MGVPHKWLVFQGKSRSRDVDDDWGGTPILGNSHGKDDGHDDLA